MNIFFYFKRPIPEAKFVAEDPELTPEKRKALYIEYAEKYVKFVILSSPEIYFHFLRKLNRLMTFLKKRELDYYEYVNIK